MFERGRRSVRDLRLTLSGPGQHDSRTRHEPQLAPLRRKGRRIGKGEGVLVWALALVGLLGLPLLSAVLPGLMLPAPWTEEDAPVLVKRSLPAPDGLAEVPRPNAQPVLVAPVPPAVVEPPGTVPRDPADPQLAKLHAHLVAEIRGQS